MTYFQAILHISTSHKKCAEIFYNRTFVLKRANSDLSSKEIERFKQEYEQMTRLSSPYIVEVYRYDGEKNVYIMEYMDFTLKEYIEKQKAAIEERKNIIYQIFRAFKFIHSQNVLHRDISPANVMIKVYDDVNVVTICDFGLVKLPDSDLTSVDTILKGCYNDPALITEGLKIILSYTKHTHSQDLSHLY